MSVEPFALFLLNSHSVHFVNRGMEVLTGSCSIAQRAIAAVGCSWSGESN